MYALAIPKNLYCQWTIFSQQFLNNYDFCKQTKKKRIFPQEWSLCSHSHIPSFCRPLLVYCWSLYSPFTNWHFQTDANLLANVLFPEPWMDLSITKWTCKCLFWLLLDMLHFQLLVWFNLQAFQKLWKKSEFLIALLIHSLKIIRKMKLLHWQIISNISPSFHWKHPAPSRTLVYRWWNRWIQVPRAKISELTCVSMETTLLRSI